MQKKNYTNYDAYIKPAPSYNLAKWMDIMKNIYLSQSRGIDRQASINEYTKDWEDDEKQAFKNWLKYYEGGEHLKYKTAQINYYIPKDENINGYFIPNPILSANPKIEDRTDKMSDVHFVQDSIAPKKDTKKTTEDYRSKLIGRILSIRRLLKSDVLDHSELEPILNTLNQLENQFRMLKKITLASPICSDLILRQANILSHNGNKIGADLMKKFAQEFQVPFYNPSPSATSKIDTGEFNALENNDISFADDNDAVDPIEQFLDNLSGAGITDKKTLNYDKKDDVKEKDDKKKANEVLAPPGPPLSDKSKADDIDSELIVEAQAAPAATKVAPIQPQEDLEVEEKPVAKEVVDAKPVKSNVDNSLEVALSNISLNDVIDKLEAIASVYKHRELSRQLAIVDIMLHQLGIANFFTELSEASAKSLESNQYILTRIENVIARLRGSVKASDLDLQPDKNINPAVKNVSDNLQKQENAEKARKEVRKKMQDAETEALLQQPGVPSENLEVELPETAPPAANPPPAANKEAPAATPAPAAQLG